MKHQADVGHHERYSYETYGPELLPHMVFIAHASQQTQCNDHQK